MTQTFPLQVFNGHLIIDCDGHQVLVDTGCPITFGRIPTLSIMGEDHPCCPSVMGVDIQSVNELLGREVDAILGLDIMSDYSMIVDCQQGQLTLSDGDEAFAGAVSLPMQNKMMYISVQAQVAGQELCFIVDTGAQLSYINPQHVQQLPSVGQRDDFHPIMGRYQVPIYDVTIGLADIQLPTQCGASPRLVQSTISLIGADGIIGYDLFAGRKVVFDFPEHILHISQS